MFRLLLLLCLTAFFIRLAVADPIKLHYTAYLVSNKEVLADVVFTPGSFISQRVGHVEISIQSFPQVRNASLTAVKEVESDTKLCGIGSEAAQPSPPGESLLWKITNKVIVTAFWFSSLTTTGSDSDTEDDCSMEKSFVDLKTAQEKIPLPKFTDVDQINGLLAFFYFAPPGSVWLQNDYETVMEGISQLTGKSIQLTAPKGSTLRKSFIPNQQTRQAPASGNTHQGWHAMSELLTNQNGELAGASSVLESYEFYMPRENKHRQRYPIIGIPSLYFLTSGTPMTGTIKGWLPEFIPTPNSRAQIYSIAADNDREENLLFHKEFPPSTNIGESPLQTVVSVFDISPRTVEGSFNIYSSAKIPWQVIVMDEGNYRLIMLRGSQSEDSTKVEEDLLQALNDD